MKTNAEIRTETPEPWKSLIPNPHPPENCGPLALTLPAGARCPTCGIDPAQEGTPAEDEPVYRATGMSVERRAGGGNYVTIARANTDDIAAHVAAGLNAMAADGRAMSWAAVASPRVLTVEWINDDYVTVTLDGRVISEVNKDEHGSDGMEAAIVAAGRTARAFGAEVRTVGTPNLEITL